MRACRTTQEISRSSLHRLYEALQPQGDVLQLRAVYPAFEYRAPEDETGG